MPPKRKANSNTKKGKGNAKQSSPAPVLNHWPLTASVKAEDIDNLMQSSYSCSMDDYNADENSVVVYMAKSTSKRGVFSDKSHAFGRIPAHYQPSARLTLHQSVVYLSVLMAAWRDGRSPKEAELLLGFRRLASYYRLVFMDLVEATASLDGPCPKDWRWAPFDHHLQRELYIGQHDPEAKEVQDFPYNDIDTVSYGM
jgi:hypothetical protein